MSIIRHKEVEVEIDFYTQNTEQMISTTPLECHVEMTPQTADPKVLSEFYFKFLLKASHDLVLDAQPVYWDVVNDHLKEIHKGANMMFTLKNLIEVEPRMTTERREPRSFIKTVFDDHGHIKYHLSHEGHQGHETYYIPVGAMAFLQYIVDTLAETDVEIFYNNLSSLIEERRSHLSKSQMRTFKLASLPPYEAH